MEWHYVEYLFISVSTFNLLLKAKYPVFHTNKKKIPANYCKLHRIISKESQAGYHLRSNKKKKIHILNNHKDYHIVGHK